MTLSSYRMHRIYLAATMGYGLGSDDPEELAYYKKLRKEIDDMKKDAVKKGIPLPWDCLLYTSPSPRDISGSRMPSSA